MNQSEWIEMLTEWGTTWGVRIGGAVALFLVAMFIARQAAAATRNTLTRRSFDTTLSTFFSNVLKWTILGAAGIACLGLVGIETASFAAAVAALGFAVGMALQGTLSNFAAGVMLLVFRPFKVGDYVSVAGQSGTVEEIGLFDSALKTPDGRRLVIPNGSVFGHTIENVSYYDNRRVDIPVGVDYSADLEKTREVLKQATQEISGILQDPAPQVFLKELGASSVDWVVRVWCEKANYWTVHEETIRIVKNALDANRLGIPFPQMDVHFDEGFVNIMRRREETSALGSGTHRRPTAAAAAAMKSSSQTG